MALLDADSKLVSPDPLPTELMRAALSVARDLGLADNWLNNGPSREPGGLYQVGLPAGFSSRLTSREYGRRLTVFLPGRPDLIHFKVFAAVDSGPGRHVDDLLALSPTGDELAAAGRWAMTHDPSEGFRMVLLSMFEKLGFGDVAERLQ
ncbi:MAG: hypothetical protein JXR37_03895 [Kiritimatiellae bacterium]|nr:hypothetical protein [Kiritimatiellia bacterium]